MNCTVSLISSFLASSPSLLWQHGTRQQGWYIGAILRKQFQNIQNLTVRFILSLTIYEVLSVVVEALLAWFVYESLGRSMPPLEVLKDHEKTSASGKASTRQLMCAVSPSDTP